MRNQILFLSFTVLFFTSISLHGQFTQAGQGIEYKIISKTNGEKINAGNFFEISFEQFYRETGKDTLLYSSRESGIQIVTFDSATIPPIYYQIFSDIQEGDSVIVRQLTDSLIVQTKGVVPAFMRKGNYIISYYKIQNIYKERSVADSAYSVSIAILKKKDSVERQNQLPIDNKKIESYLLQKKVKAIKGALGTYVQIIKPGTGAMINGTKKVKVFYTGMSLSDEKVFDSNIDSSFLHAEAYIFSMAVDKEGKAKVISGWIDGFKLLRKGAEAKLFIPSALAYGKRGTDDIMPNENLIFNIKVVDVFPIYQTKKTIATKRSAKKIKK